jgi:putative endonuclease
MAQHNELGKNGENLAAAHLIKNGYQILARNFIYQRAEVDIIAKKDDILAVVEVKTRSTPDFGDPQDFVKKKQIDQLVKAIDHYVNEHQLEVEVRFDIIAIIKNNAGTRLEHLENAFLHF